MIVGIIGNGLLGKATYSIVNNKSNEVYIYDIDPSKSKPISMNLCELRKCNLIFICVPTPIKKSGECYLDIVKDIVQKLNYIIDINHTSIILRSTVPCGTSDFLNVSFMPYFLTENNWKHDSYHCKNWILGVNNDDIIINKMKTILKEAKMHNCILYSNLQIIYNKEAEMIKLFINTFLATKISFCNEIFTFCKKQKINYDVIRHIVSLDETINSLNKNNQCFIKDVSSLQFEMKKINIETPIIDAVIYRNTNIDMTGHIF